MSNLNEGRVVLAMLQSTDVSFVTQRLKLKQAWQIVQQREDLTITIAGSLAVLSLSLKSQQLK